MKSMPQSSAIRASRRQSGQLPDHRSGTRVAERPDEQLAPNSPICRRLSPYMRKRSENDAVRPGTELSIVALYGRYGPNTLNADSTKLMSIKAPNSTLPTIKP